MESCELFARWPGTSILLISASQLTRITGMSHRPLANNAKILKATKEKTCYILRNSDKNDE
jgi:hypothetical protein